MPLLRYGLWDEYRTDRQDGDSSPSDETGGSTSAPTATTPSSLPTRDMVDSFVNTLKFELDDLHELISKDFKRRLHIEGWGSLPQKRRAAGQFSVTLDHQRDSIICRFGITVKWTRFETTEQAEMMQQGHFPDAATIASEAALGEKEFEELTKTEHGWQVGPQQTVHAFIARITRQASWWARELLEREVEGTLEGR